MAGRLYRYILALASVLYAYSTASAQDDTTGFYKSIEQTVKNSGLYTEYLFGFCFDKVRKRPVVDYEIHWHDRNCHASIRIGKKGSWLKN